MAVYAETYRIAQRLFGDAAGRFIRDTEEMFENVGGLERARETLFLQLLIATDNFAIKHCGSCPLNKENETNKAHANSAGAFCAK